MNQIGHLHLCAYCQRNTLACSLPECAKLEVFGSCRACMPKRRTAGDMVGRVVLVVALAFGARASADDALPAPVATPAKQAPCTWSESQGVGATYKLGRDRSSEVRVRGEGECSVRGTFVALRVDGWAAPGGDKAPTFADLGTISAGEAWLRVRRPVWRDVSVFGLAGIQTALHDGQIGLGGSNTSLGVGIHYQLGRAWADVGVVDRYTASGPGARMIAALSVPLLRGVTVSLNGAVGHGGWTLAPATMAGPGSAQ